MKVLCALDFSNTSVNAAKWINEFLYDLGGGEITFIHCMAVQHRAIAFNPMEDILKDNAEQDIKKLIDFLKKEGITYKVHIAKAEPKTYINQYSNHIKADWVVTGTKGLTALKEMTVGSLTESLIKESTVPVIAVPLNIKYKKPETIVLGIDHKIIDNEQILKPLKSITNVIDAKLILLHINSPKDDILKFDPTYEIYFSVINYELKMVPQTGTITDTLNDYCEKNGVDLLTMIHHKRNWLQELFQFSSSKKELFDLRIPLFILPENN